MAEPAEFAIYHLQKMLGQYGPLSLLGCDGATETHLTIRYKLPLPIRSFLLPLFYRLVVYIFLYRIGALWNYKAPIELVTQISPRVCQPIFARPIRDLTFAAATTDARHCGRHCAIQTL